MKNRKIAISLIFIFLLLIPTTTPIIISSENSKIAKSTFSPQINITKPTWEVYLNNHTIITWKLPRTLELMWPYFEFLFWFITIPFMVIIMRTTIIGDILIETEVNIPHSEIQYVEFKIINIEHPYPVPSYDYVIVEKDYTWPYSYYWDYHPRLISTPSITVSVYNNSGNVIAYDSIETTRIL